jgi:DNA-binding NarL/FixJ family response regulator
MDTEFDLPTPAMTNDTPLIRILSVDDHPLLRSGIAALIDTQPDMRMVGEASNGNEAVQLHRQLNPDVTLMDLQMPDMSGLDAIISIRTEQPSARIIVLTTYAGDVLAQRALKAGAQAYVLKSLVRTEILNTIRIVYAGEKQVQAHVSPRFQSKCRKALARAATRRRHRASIKSAVPHRPNASCAGR